MTNAFDVAPAVLESFCRRRHHVRKLCIFGSVLRSAFSPESDIDVLFELEPGHTPGLAFFGLQDELSELSVHKVGLNTPAFLSRYFRQDVLRVARVQYEICLRS